jgi:hypothetical protein
LPPFVVAPFEFLVRSAVKVEVPPGQSVVGLALRPSTIQGSKVVTPPLLSVIVPLGEFVPHQLLVAVFGV